MRITKYFFAFLTITTISLSSVHAEGLSKEAMFSRLSALAPSGNADIKYNLGMFLNNGIGTARDNKTAYKYFTEAAELGHELASYKVGYYLAGQFPGTVPVNEAEAGYDLAQFDVGMHFIKKRDLENANLWWERASRQGNMQATLAYLYYLSKSASPNEVTSYALGLMLKEMMPDPTKELLAHIATLETKLTTEQKSEANTIRASWFTGKTPLTLKAQEGINALLALLASLER
ncbi:tetratricopeptide repeat protein [Undibacterium flavidum]|uniref:Sel1 repeat family protein n=1 Tax=Undibacterium flavidum TaxID=2762297 RepID=A0ABR6YHH8_9BURK|nr:tetratricopeptide repeat protein [Undibacterium flavidum]MBC3875983.1 sel1 repeat family protein [Undibacterium flavidum]